MPPVHSVTVPSPQASPWIFVKVVSSPGFTKSVMTFKNVQVLSVFLVTYCTQCPLAEFLNSHVQTEHGRPAGLCEGLLGDS